ncbi:MAG: serine/threonine-protein kinase [Planctomycetota bacterium]
MSTDAETIGPYRLGARLGEGGFAAVYEGTHEETGERAAIKLLHLSREMDPEVQNRFVREVAILKRLEHENIVGHYDAGLHDGKIYCALELVECGTLKDVLAQRISLPWREAAEVARQVALALEHAHENGCVHRDLKPANLFLSEAGLVKLGDLGLARDLTDSRLTAQGQTVGSYRYMPPEQIRGEADIDGRLDIYALGCIVFEMVAGHVPFDGPDFATIFDQHLEASPPRLDVLSRGCPKALADLVEQMLEKDRDDRPKTGGEVAAALGAVLSGEVVKANDGSNTGVPANLTQRLRTGPAASESKPFNPILIALAIVVAVAVASALAAGAYFFLL